MIHSMMDNEIWKEEFELMVDQSHFERVWSVINPILKKYIDSYIEEISKINPTLKAEDNIKLYIKQLIDKHVKYQDKYAELFSPDLMEEYAEDVDGFKGSVLSRQCTVIQKTLSSKSEALKDWKISFKLAKPQELYDTFYNMITFAEDYNERMTEEEMKNIDTIEDNELVQMVEDSCYLQGVIGTGILSTVLNNIYPRVFPGQMKIGMFALYILSDRKTVDMRSNSSEFLMVKDDIPSKTGTIEVEHNYYYPYETFALYSLRIYRELDEVLNSKYSIKFPVEYRYVLTNDFYQFVFDANKDNIKTLLGNDDILKFGNSI